MAKGTPPAIIGSQRGASRNAEVTREATAYFSNNNLRRTLSRVGLSQFGLRARRINRFAWSSASANSVGEVYPLRQTGSNFHVTACRGNAALPAQPQLHAE